MYTIYIYIIQSSSEDYFYLFLVGLMIQKEVELADLKSKVAEVMAFIPTSPSSFSAVGTGILGIRYSPSFGVAQIPNIEGDVLCKSSLNPAASDYTPKITQ